MIIIILIIILVCTLIHINDNNTTANNNNDNTPEESRFSAVGAAANMNCLTLGAILDIGIWLRIHHL